MHEIHTRWLLQGQSYHSGTHRAVLEYKLQVSYNIALNFNPNEFANQVSASDPLYVRMEHDYMQQFLI